jgi:ribosomal protein S18 acetylase RimI-like enzyme
VSAPTRPFELRALELGRCALAAPPSAAEAEAIGALLAAMDPWATLGVTAAGLAAYLGRDDPALRRYAVRVEGAVAGVVCVRWPWLRGPYIELLGLAPTCQGRGIGAELLAWTEAEARKAGSNLWVAASSFNPRALEFYRRQGFVEVGLIEDLVRPGFDEVLLRKRLDGEE